ncbi:MAG: hypothetical protein PUC32_04350 [Oscillospiraceae bacterium]|nr:hypothetical protein [Oscillospiraceae bacterium]
MDNKKEQLPAISPLPEDQEIVDEIRSAVSRLRKEKADPTQVVSGVEQDTLELEQAMPVRSVSEVRPVGGDGKETPAPEIPKPANEPQREIPTPPAPPQKEMPTKVPAGPEIASEEHGQEKLDRKAAKEEKKRLKKERKEEKKEQKAQRKQKKGVSDDTEEDLYEGIHIRSYDEIKRELEQNKPKVSEPTSTFTYLFDDTVELPTVLLTKDPQELKREREERAQHAVEEALSGLSSPDSEETLEVSADIDADKPLAPEFGHRQAAKPDDRPIIIDGFDYTEWKRTTQQIPVIDDDLLAAHARSAMDDTLPVQVRSSDDGSGLPVQVDGQDLSMDPETEDPEIQELEELLDQALATPEAMVVHPTSKPKAPVQKKAEPAAKAEAPVQKKAQPAAKAEAPVQKAEPAVKAEAPVQKAEPAAKADAPVQKAEPAAKTEAPVQKAEPAAKTEAPVQKTEPAAKAEAPMQKAEPAAKAEAPAQKAEPAAKAEAPVQKTEPAAKAEAPMQKAEPAAKAEAPVQKAEPAAKTEVPVQKAVPHFVPVSDPERYRFQRIPVRTFRLEQINALLAAELETYRNPNAAKAEEAVSPDPSQPPSAQKDRPTYGKRISIHADAIGGIEAAIAAAIAQADKNDQQQVESVPSANNAPAEKEAPVSPAVTPTPEPAPRSSAEKAEEAATEPEPPENVPEETPLVTQAPSEETKEETKAEPEPAQAEPEPAAETPEPMPPADTPVAKAEETAEGPAKAEEAKETETAEKTPVDPAEETSTAPAEIETPESAAPENDAKAEPQTEDAEKANVTAQCAPETTITAENPAEATAESAEEAPTPTEEPTAAPATEIPEKPDTLAHPVPTAMTSTKAPQAPSDDRAEAAKEPPFPFVHKQVTAAAESPDTPDPEEYTQNSDPKKISKELQTATKELQIRSVVTGFFTGALLVLSAIFEWFVPQTASPLPYLILNLFCLVVPAAVCAKTLWNGIKALFGLQGNTDSGIAIAVLATIIQSIALFFDGSLVMTGAIHIYSSIAVGALFLNTLGKLSMMNRISRNFIFVTSADSQCSVEFYADINVAIQLAKGCVSEAPKIAYQRKTNFLCNFLRHSYESDPSMWTSQLVAPIALVASVVLSIVTFIITGSVLSGLTALSIATCISAPIASLLCVNLPVAKLCKLARRHGAMLSGYEAVEKLSNTNAVMLDSTDLFPKDSVSLADVKVYAGKKTERAILSAAAIMSNIGGTLRDLFEGVITSQKEMLPKASDIVYVEGQGMMGIVGGKRVLIGNRQMMEEQHIKLPNEDKNAKLSANQCILFLVEEQELMAMLTVAYDPDPHTVHEMQRLESCGIAAIVRTLDPNLTTEFLSTLFLMDEHAIKVLPAELGDCCDEALQTPAQSCDALLATRGKSFSMMRMLSACVRQKHNIALAVIMQIVSVILGFVLVAFLSCYAGLQQLSTLAILLYEAFWLAAILIIPKLRKP